MYSKVIGIRAYTWKVNMKNIIDAIKLRKKNGNTVFVCGNGGSASTAEHFTNDLFSVGVRAVCLNSNVSIITMIANDYGYGYIFSKQLRIYAEPNDLLVVFSCSGKSLNIINAELEARYKDIEVIKIFGAEGESYRDAEVRHLALTHQISSGIT